jgi:hypothetical protein
LTGLTTLRAAMAVIAASLLGGCADNIIGAPGSHAGAVLHSALRNASGVAAANTAPPQGAGAELRQQLAAAALDDAKLGDIRGGYDIASGVTLNFAFQQATYVNHDLAQTIVVPTMTISPGQGSSAVSAAGAVQPSVSVGSLNALGVAGAQAATAGGGVNAATVVANGVVQTQVSVSNSTVQALVNSGLASVVGGAGNSGLTTTLVNGANNQLIQQMTTLDIGVSGLSKLMQQNINSSIINRLNGPSTLR